MSTEINYAMVQEFHSVYGMDPVPFVKSFPLRMELIREEAEELSEAVSDKDEVAIVDALTDLLYVLYGGYISFGVRPETILDTSDTLDNYDVERLEGHVDSLVVDMYTSYNFDYILDRMAEMAQVIYIAGKDLGYDLDGAFKEVHRSNLSKLDDNGKPVKRLDGKILKGPNFTPPNLAPFVPKVD
tara:strand:- start:14256 stop:14810 length:555 start_codon:yes stop_codon:yes gene_type:complete